MRPQPCRNLTRSCQSADDRGIGQPREWTRLVRSDNGRPALPSHVLTILSIFRVHFSEGTHEIGARPGCTKSEHAGVKVSISELRPMPGRNLFSFERRSGRICGETQHEWPCWRRPSQNVDASGAAHESDAHREMRQETWPGGHRCALHRPVQLQRRDGPGATARRSTRGADPQWTAVSCALWRRPGRARAVQRRGLHRFSIRGLR